MEGLRPFFFGESIMNSDEFKKMQNTLKEEALELEANRHLMPEALRKHVSSVGVDLPDNLSFEDWEESFLYLLKNHRGESWSNWALGGFMVFGEKNYGKKYKGIEENLYRGIYG